MCINFVLTSDIRPHADVWMAVLGYEPVCRLLVRYLRCLRKYVRYLLVQQDFYGM